MMLSGKVKATRVGTVSLSVPGAQRIMGDGLGKLSEDAHFASWEAQDNLLL